MNSKHRTYNHLPITIAFILLCRSIRNEKGECDVGCIHPFWCYSLSKMACRLWLDMPSLYKDNSIWPYASVCNSTCHFMLPSDDWDAALFCKDFMLPKPWVRHFVSTFHTLKYSIWAKSDENSLRNALPTYFSTFQNLRLGTIRLSKNRGLVADGCPKRIFGRLNNHMGNNICEK